MTDFSAYRGYLTVVLINLTALGAIVWQIREPTATAVRIEPAPTRTPPPTATQVCLHVYVSGAVATPGVVVLDEGDRVREAIAAAGGFSDEADQPAVNLAAPLADGQQLHVPAEGEAAGPPAGISGVADGALSSASSASRGGNTSSRSSVAGSAININTATAAELEALPGVGPALAGRIIAHREANGPFGSPEGLLAVSGIGEKTLAGFVDLVVVH